MEHDCFAAAVDHRSVGGFCGLCGVVWPCSAARHAVLAAGGPGLAEHGGTVNGELTDRHG
jgi:hypothetical protein